MPEPETHRVDQVDLGTEELIPLWSSDESVMTALTVLKSRGIIVSRPVVYRWASVGMPVGGRGGDKLILPTVFYGNRRQTSVEALARFVARIKELSEGDHAKLQARVRQEVPDPR